MIRRINKLFLLLGVILLSTLLFGCVENIKTNTWFSKDILHTYHIQNLPQIEDENAVLINDDNQNELIYFNSTLDDINKYTEKTLNYLKNNEQIYHLSSFNRIEKLGEENVLIYNKVDYDFKFNSNEYSFAFSNTSQTFEKYGLVGLNDPVIISIGYVTDPLLYLDREYSAYIKIYNFSGFIAFYKEPVHSNPDETIIYPQTLVVNGLTYNMIVDMNHSLIYELDELIGHIIREEILEQYNADYPNLVPVVDNFVKNKYTNNMIEIYTVKNKNSKQFLAIKIVMEGNIVNTEIFEASQ